MRARLTCLAPALCLQLLEVRRRHETESEARELRHLAELEAAVEGSGIFEATDGSEDSLAVRLRALEARRTEQEGELEALRWGGSLGRGS